MPGLSHGGSFKETSVFSCRPRRLRARPPLSMGEMQGALARARLESLLRPRHKKRAEAQKRSESFLLTGLGKRRRGTRALVTPPTSRLAPASRAAVGDASGDRGMGGWGGGVGGRRARGEPPGAWPHADPGDKGARGRPPPARPPGAREITLRLARGRRERADEAAA